MSSMWGRKGNPLLVGITGQTFVRGGYK
jgi:hypothetical protein